MTDFHLTEGLTGDPNILTSQFYLEGLAKAPMPGSIRNSTRA